MVEADCMRRRADSATVAGEQMVLYRPSGEIARIALVVDQLDDGGLRTPLVEDALSAFPHAELHVTCDARASRQPILGRKPWLWSTPEARPRGLFRRRRARTTPKLELGDYDLVLRIGDRRSRGFTAKPEALDLTYILDIDDGLEAASGPSLGASLRDRCAMQAADRVWCSTRRLSATLRRRWNVDAQLLYPPAELQGAHVVDTGRRFVIAAADDISPSWNSRLDTLARWRDDPTVVKHGTPAKPSRDGRRARVEPATPERFRALLPHALAVVMPPADRFDPRAVWAAEAGVPVVTPISSAAAELVEGLERRRPTGVLLEESTETALADAIAFIERRPAMFAADHLRHHAARWGHDRFRKTLKSLVLDAWCAHVAEEGMPEEPEAPAAAVVATAGAATV